MTGPRPPGGARAAEGESESFALTRDGTRLRLRRVRPGDEGLLRGVFTRLSPESRHGRFLAGVARLSETHLRGLVGADAVTRDAWIALDAGAAGQPGLGFGQYVRLPRETRVAELAIVVADAHQHLGIGRRLLEVLSRSAAAQGIETFRSWVLRSNPATRSLHDLGAVIHHVEGETLCLDIPVPRDPGRVAGILTGRASVRTRALDTYAAPARR